MTEETKINPLLTPPETTPDVAPVVVPYTEMPYQDLKKLAASRGLNASGTAELIIERLNGFDVATKGMIQSASNTSEKTPPQTVAPAPVMSSATVDQAWKSDAMKIKESLDKQPKQTILIPFDSGEMGNLATAQKIPFTVIINGYRYEVKRGMPVEVPKQVAEIYYERMQSEGRINAEYAQFLNKGRSEQLQG